MVRSRRSKRTSSVEDEEGGENMIVEEESQSQRRKSRKTAEDVEEDENNDMDNAAMFSSQVPELSQDILPVRMAERNNFMRMGAESREKAIQDVLRLVLFRGMSGESIDRTKILKELEISDSRISTAIFDDVNERLKNVFDFELKRLPTFMENMKHINKSLKDRYYLINIAEDDDGNHSRILHSINAIEKGFLMVVLGFCFCKGSPLADGSRWILDKDLYTLLNRLDENISNEPPVQSSKRSRVTLELSQQLSQQAHSETPDVDALLTKFVNMDYLLLHKADDQFIEMNEAAEETSVFYALGPRAAMEIGRSQIVHFCAESLDQEPDPAMLQEITQNEGEE